MHAAAGTLPATAPLAAIVIAPARPPPQTDLTEVGLGDPSASGPQFVKPGDLSTVIAASHGDFLIVVGDKNMRNETCQARRAGKLVEVSVDERITAVLESWASQTGLRPTAVSSASTSSAGFNSGAGGDMDRVAVAALSEAALYERLKRATGVAHVPERLQRAVAAVAEVLEERRRAGGRAGARAAAAAAAASATAGAASALLPATSPTAGGALSDSDAALVANLTKAQTGLVRLHRELADAAAILRRTPVTATQAAAQGGRGASSAAASRGLDLGLGLGVQVPASFRPPTAASGGSVSGAAAAAAVTAAAPLPPLLRARLLELVAAQCAHLEAVGARIAEVAGPGGSALWRAYYSVRASCGCAYAAV